MDPVTVPSNVSTSVWVNEGLLKHSPGLLNQPGSYGSVVFRFTSFNAMNLYADTVPSIHGEPIAFPVRAHPAWQPAGPPRGNGPGSLEGIWWQPRAGLNDFLVISNSSEKKISGALSLFDASGKRWSELLVLAPRQTLRMATSDLLRQAGLGGSYGGISFAVPASASAVDGVHFMYNESAKFSASLEMFRRDPNSTLLERAGKDAKQWTMREPMLALRTPDPAIGLPPGTLLQPTIFVRNITANSIAADIALSWRGDSGKGQAKLPELQLAPFATQQLPIGTMQKQLGIPENAHWALVSLTTTASPDDLIAIASSRDNSGRYGAEAGFVGGLGDYFVGGEWRADANHNQIISVTNSGQKPADALLTLHYDNGEKKYEMQQTIQPSDQMWVNLAELIRNRVPDRKGNLLPVDVRAVTYDLQDLTVGSHSLMANALSVDKRLGFSVRHDYPRCCPTDAPGWSPGVFDVVIDGTDFGEITGFNSCTGTLGNISGLFSNWWSANPAIATVAKTGAVTGVSAGYTTASASGRIMDDGCISVPVQVDAPVTVQVPTSLSIVAGTDSTSGESTCSAGSAGTGCGCARTFTYQVNDQYENPMKVAGLAIWDEIHTTSPNNLSITGYQTTCTPANTGPCGAATDANGQFEESPGLIICSTVCRVNGTCTKGGPTNANQTVHVGSASIVQNLAYYCDHVTVNGK